MAEETRTLYEVERFSPARCPKCRHPFEKMKDDWVIGVHRLIEPGIQKNEHFIICKHCENWTIQTDHETYTLSDLGKARVLVTLGFVNLHEVEASGNFPDNSYSKGGLIYRLSIVAETENKR